MKKVQLTARDDGTVGVAVEVVLAGIAGDVLVAAVAGSPYDQKHDYNEALGDGELCVNVIQGSLAMALAPETKRNAEVMVMKI